MGSMYTGNYWQLELDSQRNSWNNPKQINVKVLLLHRVEAKERVYLSGESDTAWPAEGNLHKNVNYY